MNKMPQKRYCKKCGCELISTKRYKRCDACRRKTVNRIIKGVEATLVGGITVFGVVAKLRSNKNNKY